MTSAQLWVKVPAKPEQMCIFRTVLTPGLDSHNVRRHLFHRAVKEQFQLMCNIGKTVRNVRISGKTGCRRPVFTSTVSDLCPKSGRSAFHDFLQFDSLLIKLLLFFLCPGVIIQSNRSVVMDHDTDDRSIEKEVSGGALLKP